MIRRALAAILLAAGFVATLLVHAERSSAAPVVGISDQRAESWTQPRLRALGLRHARLVVPWNAATSEPAAVQAWLDAVAAAGKEPHIAFEHLRTDRCPSRPCVTPTRAQYRAAVQAFLARFPQVRTFTTWNEGNHRTQPVASNPEAVAGYYDELVAACPACTIVAGDVLDSGAHVSWLRRFQAATALQPQLWGLHNYGDVTYGGTDGTDDVLAAVPGQLWIEETGGIVVLRDSSGRTTLRSDEARASTAISRAFAIARARPRITRMYVYHWKARAFDRFDAGLVRPDDTARPSYTTLLQELGGAAPATTTPMVPALRWRAAWSKATPNQLLLRATCRASDRRCTGRLRIVLRTQRRARGGWAVTTLTTRSYRTSASARTATLRITVSKKLRTRARTALRRRLALTVTPTRPAGAVQRSTVAVARPAR
ncbi:hypothetical protein LRS13_19515 [Svornostia abyssi]|uniref:Asl1-like glycosyl hydrolase catalytic domain-containing protein n=1 Tax=Svornostia abyssi TaxID=2898438 RepID=A0ABY5PE17_9ACTN|nr:hypothetical protein LRS13_19515 [Parviterribacteraceae bacterium J379]